MTTPTPENQVVADLAAHAAARDVIVLVDDRRHGIVLEDGQRLTEIDLDRYQPTPARATGAVSVADADSLALYVNRHRDAYGTTLWADESVGRIVAVLNDHERGYSDTLDGDTPPTKGGPQPGWGDHRATLQLRATPDWLHWTKYDGKLLPQDTFAEHLEDGADAIREPAAATMLEVAQSFHAKKGVNFSSSRHLGGEIEFGYEETVQARAGQKGKLDIPATFTLGLAPYEGAPLYEVRARLRFRLTDGQLCIGYRLIRPDRTRKAAFGDVAAQVAGDVQLTVMSGTPRQ